MGNSVVFNTDLEFWQGKLRVARYGGLVSVKEEAHGSEFEIELAEANDGYVMVRSSFCPKSSFYPKSRGITCTAINARDVQSLVDEVKEINRLISKGWRS
jgi:hypothetical protein